MVMTMYIAARNEAIENGPFKSKIMPLHSAIQLGGPLSISYLQRYVLKQLVPARQNHILEPSDC